MSEVDKGILIGFHHSEIDESSGVPVSFHIVDGVHLSFSSDYYVVTLASYYNQAAYEHGRRSLLMRDFRLDVRPDRGVDLIDWALRALQAQPMFEQAELVYRNQDAGV